MPKFIELVLQGAPSRGRELYFTLPSAPVTSSLMGVVSEGVFVEGLRNLRRFTEKMRQKMMRKLCGKFAEISQKYAEKFLE